MHWLLSNVTLSLSLLSLSFSLSLSSETNRQNTEQAQKMQQLEDRIISLERYHHCDDHRNSESKR